MVIYNIGLWILEGTLKENPQISKIAIDKQKLKDLQDRLKNPRITDTVKNALIKHVAGGICSQCDEIPTKIVSYDMHGAKLIEKYCDKCFKKWDKFERKK